MRNLLYLPKVTCLYSSHTFIAVVLKEGQLCFPGHFWSMQKNFFKDLLIYLERQRESMSGGGGEGGEDRGRGRENPELTLC